jgi:hypothetical protein
MVWGMVLDRMEDGVGRDVISWDGFSGPAYLTQRHTREVRLSVASYSLCDLVSPAGRQVRRIWLSAMRVKHDLVSLHIPCVT